MNKRLLLGNDSTTRFTAGVAFATLYLAIHHMHSLFPSQSSHICTELTARHSREGIKILDDADLETRLKIVALACTSVTSTCKISGQGHKIM